MLVAVKKDLWFMSTVFELEEKHGSEELASERKRRS